MARPEGAPRFLFPVLFLLGIHRVLLSNWVVFFQFELLTWILLILVVVPRIIHVTLANAVIVALTDHFNESIL